MNRSPDDPIEVYLDQLLIQLPGTPRHVRHTLSEVEAHLHDSAAAAEADGLDEHAAAVLAVQRMGPIDGVVDSRAFPFRLTPARRRRTVLGALFVGAAGGLAVGVAGLVAAVVRIVAGDAAVGIPFPTGAYSQSDCTRWMAAYPNARDCVAAMTIDHANDFLLSAAAAGVVGVVCLSLFVWLRHRWNSHAVAAVVPAYAEDIATGVVALLAAMFLFAQGIDAVLVTHGQGAGQWFSLATAAFGAAVVCAARGWSRARLPHFTSRRIVL